MLEDVPEGFYETDEVGDLGSPDQSCAHALVLVQRHADALAGTAHGNAGIDGPRLDGLAQGMAEVGVVTAGLARRAEVAIDDAALGQVLLNEFFQRVAGVIAGQPNNFDIHRVIN